MGSDFLLEFKRLGVTFSSESGEEVTGLCPFHNDNTSSFSLNITTGLWKCFVSSCKGFHGGNYQQAVKLITGKDLDEALGVPEEEVQRFHDALLKDKVVVKWLEDARGLSMETLKRFKLGLDDGRICIPIYHERKCVNLRRHAINKGIKPKMLSYKLGYGSLRLFPEEGLSGASVLLCEGELDTILAIQLGFNAMSVTGGAGSWKDIFTSKLQGKQVDICYDIDQAGRDGALTVCKMLAEGGVSSRNVLLPIMTPPNGDITDFFVTHSLSAGDLREAIEATPPFQAIVKAPKGEKEAASIELKDATRPDRIGNLLKFKAMVS